MGPKCMASDMCLFWCSHTLFGVGRGTLSVLIGLDCTGSAAACWCLAFEASVTAGLVHKHSPVTADAHIVTTE